MDPAGPYSNRWFRLSGLALLAFVLWTALRYIALDIGSEVSGDLYDLSSSLGFRFVVCVVAVAFLYHGLNGIRIVLLELTTTGPRIDHYVAPAVLFLTFALALPAWAAIFRPYLT